MVPILVIAFILVPLAELAVLIAVGDWIGLVPTLILLLVVSVAGAWLAKREGLAAWARFQRALAEGRVPTVEVADGAMILLAGALLLTPGFLTDVAGVLLLLPPTRAMARRLAPRLAERRLRRRGVRRVVVDGTPRPAGSTQVTWGPAEVADRPSHRPTAIRSPDDGPAGGGRSRRRRFSLTFRSRERGSSGGERTEHAGAGGGGRAAAGRRAPQGLAAEGFAVDVALDGTDGLWMAREHPYDAIVLDIMLPGVNGYRLCSTLRREGNWTPILMLTAKDGEWDEVEALDSGADDYLTKPFSYAVLLARLRALLRRGAPERPAVLEAGDLRLDPAAKRAWRGDAEVELTARELALLEFLLRRRGEAVPKREILAHVWDDQFEGDPNIVEVYVRHLRNKLDRPFGRAAIQTVRGSGYRLVPDGG